MKKSIKILLASLFTILSLYYLTFDHKQQEGVVLEQLPAQSMQVELNYGRIPLHFEPNTGQAEDEAIFLARGSGYSLSLTSAEAVFTLSKTANKSKLQSHTLRMKLAGANLSPNVEGLDVLPGKSNYLLGSDPEQWHTGVANYARVKYSEIYPGIDLIYYGNQQQLEYDFVVAPEVDPGSIVMEFDGAERIELDESGNLRLQTGNDHVILQAPVIYQETLDERQQIAGAFEVRENKQVGFQIGDYNPDLTLVIDPILTYSTYFGGSGSEFSEDIAVDAAGNIYITGSAPLEFPVTENAAQRTNGGSDDVFVAKISADGSELLYATYIGGRGIESGTGIAVDADGNAYVTGFTRSEDLPTINAVQSNIGGSGDAFVTKLNPDGSAFLYSTYLGGGDSEIGFDIAVDADGNAYVTGRTFSENFPTINAVQPTIGDNSDAFVTKLSVTGSFLFSTYLSFSQGFDDGRGIAVDRQFDIYLTGGAGTNVFVTKMKANGSALIYTYIFGGDANDNSIDIAVDADGNAYVTGETFSENFPTKNAVQPNPGVFRDCFISKVAADGSTLLFSTYLGGTAGESNCRSIALDAGSNIYITGSTLSSDFPIKDPIQETLMGFRDVFITQIAADGSEILFSTFLGGSEGSEFGRGIAVADDAIYVTGNTTSDDFPVESPLQAGRGGSSDAFVVKVETQIPIIVNSTGDDADANRDDTVCSTGETILRDGQEEPECTLRAAIQTANSRGEPLGISFDLPDADVPVIRPKSALPDITAPVDLDGTTHPANLVRIDGSAAAETDGLVLSGRNIRVKGIMIDSFTGAGIRIVGGSGHLVRDNVIGMNRNGTELRLNSQGGIIIEAGAENIEIGGVNPPDMNLIGGGIRVLGEQTQGIRLLRNNIRLRPEDLADGDLIVPFDLGGDGPTCVPWSGETPGTPNRGVAPPRVLELRSNFIRGTSRPEATVVAYRVDASGTGRGRYWARDVTPIGDAKAAADGTFEMALNPVLASGDRITLSMTDVTGNTSELAQVRRPVIFLPGVGGSWLEADDGNNLFIPLSTFDYEINRLLARLAMDETGTTNLDGSTVTATGILEEPLMPYRAVLQHLQASGYTGTSDNSSRPDLDLWRFWYDWRRDPSKIADQLMDRIDAITAFRSDENVAASCEVDIVTHSNGGMVASAYVFKYREHSKNRVNRLVMSAAPYLGTPQVVEAHTRGYLFDVQENIHSDFDWGVLIRSFQNLPDGYGLLPGRAYVDLIDPDAPMQNDWYLTDLNGKPLRGYDETLAFMAAPKLDPADGTPHGLARNGTMWMQQQTDLHDVMNDWRSYAGPPHVFRQVGRLPQSTAMAWRVPSLLDLSGNTDSERKDVGDTNQHIAYRESLMPRLGWGDGTVALVSATLGGGVTEGGTPVGRQDYSGRESVWIEPFEYFPCNHLGIVAPACEGDTGNALERLSSTLRSSHELVPVSASKGRIREAPVVGRTEVFYIESTGPITVYVQDDSGARTGPADDEPFGRVLRELPGVGYWAGRSTAVVSLPGKEAFTVVVSSAGATADVRVTRNRSEGDDASSILFEDRTLQPGGSLKFSLAAGGTDPDTPFDLDSDGDGAFESVLVPAAQTPTTEAGPAIPVIEPAAVSLSVAPGSSDPVAAIRISEAGGPVWSWSIDEIPDWIQPGLLSGQNPADLNLTLSIGGQEAGVIRDTISIDLTLDELTQTIQVPVQVALRDQPARLDNIVVFPSDGTLVPGDSLVFWAQGIDELGLSMNIQPVWSATGGTISESGTYIAGPSAGTFSVTASDESGAVSGSAQIEIFNNIAVSIEEEEEVPTAFHLYQNYPNPFNPQTIIKYQLPEAAQVKLEIYNVLGQKVTTLVDTQQAAGNYSIVWNGSSGSGGFLASGIYLYRLQADDFVEVKKLTLLK